VRALADVHPNRPWVLLFGAMSDKAIEDMLAPLLSSPTLRQVIFTPIQSPRAATPLDLCARVHLPSDCAASSLTDALSRAAAAASPDALLVIAGSIYLLGEVLLLLDEPWQGLVTYAPNNPSPNPAEVSMPSPIDPTLLDQDPPPKTTSSTPQRTTRTMMTAPLKATSRAPSAICSSSASPKVTSPKNSSPPCSPPPT
jgi:hypothetical protein